MSSRTFTVAGAWDFGGSSDWPALVYADYDGSGADYNCNDYPAKIPGTTMDLTCGSSLVGNFRPTP